MLRCFTVPLSLAGRTEKVYKKKTVKKGAGKELCYNRESQEVKQALDQARRKEWDNWKNYSNMQKLSREEFAKIKQKDPGLRIIPTKWVDTSKAEEGQPLKAKSRFVVRGDLEDASGMRTDSPTASQVAMGLLISFAASTSRPLRSGDISAAFLQGSVLDRSLVLSMPKNAAPYDMDEEDLVLVSTTVYETKDAPRGWFKKLDGSLQKKQLRRVPMEPGFYGLNGQGGDGSTCVRGLLLVHVDDILWTGDQHMEQIMKEIQDEYKFGSLDSGTFKYCGRFFAQSKNGISVTCPDLITRVRPIQLDRGSAPPLPTRPNGANCGQSPARSIGWFGCAALTLPMVWPSSSVR